jgi:hypothetical protein
MTERSEGITKSETFRSSDKQASERSERAKRKLKIKEKVQPVENKTQYKYSTLDHSNN